MFVYIATKVRSQLRERAGTRVFVYLYVYINEKYTLSEGFTLSQFCTIYCCNIPVKKGNSEC